MGFLVNVPLKKINKTNKKKTSQNTVSSLSFKWQYWKWSVGGKEAYEDGLLWSIGQQLYLGVCVSMSVYVCVCVCGRERQTDAETETVP